MTVSRRVFALMVGTVLAASGVLAACGSAAPANKTSASNTSASSTASSSSSSGTSSSAGGTSTASALPSLTLKFATNLPTSHYLSVQGDQVFMKAVKDLSQGKVKIQYYPNSQLGKAGDMITMANTGVAAIVAASPPYVSAQMPLSNAFDLPGILPNADVGSAAYALVANNPNSVISKTDFQRNGLHFLYAATLPLYQFVTVKQAIHQLSDLKGLKFRSGGGAEDLVVRALGAVPVTMTRSSDYEAFQRGTLNGGIFNLPSLHPNKVDEVTHYATTNANVTSFVYAVEISATKWKSLPANVQTILTEAAKKAQTSLATNMDKDNTQAITFLKGEGMTFTTLSASAVTQLDKALQPVDQQWISEMKSDGWQGTTAIQEVKAAVKAAQSGS